MGSTVHTENKRDEIFNSNSQLCSLCSLQNKTLTPQNTPLLHSFLELHPYGVEPPQCNMIVSTVPFHDLRIALHQDVCMLHMLQNIAFHSQCSNSLLLALHHAFISNASKTTVSFDIDSISIILDTGATAAFTFSLSDFTSSKVMNSKVNSVG